MTTPEIGSVSWLEIPVLSFTRAAKFYADVLGWETKGLTEDGTEPEGYPPARQGGPRILMFSQDKTHGSFCKVPESAIVKAAAPGQLENVGVVVTFTTASIEETLAKVQKAGGTVHVPKTGLGNGMGHIARFVDTEGNLQSLWALQ